MAGPRRVGLWRRERHTVELNGVCLFGVKVTSDKQRLEGGGIKAPAARPKAPSVQSGRGFWTAQAEPRLS